MLAPILAAGLEQRVEMKRQEKERENTEISRRRILGGRSDGSWPMGTGIVLGDRREPFGLVRGAGLGPGHQVDHEDEQPDGPHADHHRRVLDEAAPHRAGQIDSQRMARKRLAREEAAESHRRAEHRAPIGRLETRTRLASGRAGNRLERDEPVHSDEEGECRPRVALRQASPAQSRPVCQPYRREHRREDDCVDCPGNAEEQREAHDRARLHEREAEAEEEEVHVEPGNGMLGATRRARPGSSEGRSPLGQRPKRSRTPNLTSSARAASSSARCSENATST